MDVNNSKADFDEQIMELRGKLLEVNEVRQSSILVIDFRNGEQEIKKYQGPNSDELKAKADEAAREVVKQQSDRLGNLMRKSRAQKRKVSFHLI